jgi:hypothetical protein
MWGNVLEWVKALGAGSIIGVFVGAQLTRRSQDRQFERQAVTQRVDRARVIYQQARVLGHRLTGGLAPRYPTQFTLPTSEAAEQADAVHRELFEATVRLTSEGASAVAHQYVRAQVQSQWMCGVITGELEERPLPDITRYWAAWHDLAAELDAADVLWEQWQAKQTARPPRRRIRWPWHKSASDQPVTD